MLLDSGKPRRCGRDRACLVPISRTQSGFVLIIMQHHACLAAIVLALFSLPAHAETEAEALGRAKAANSRGDYTTSSAIYRGLEQQGSAAGARGIGLLLWAGAGVPKDHARACDEFAKAEQGGDALATEMLGDCYRNADGRDRDYARSAQLYTAAGSRGLPIAFCALGNQYLAGQGVAPDPAKAAALCRRSADLGVADAQTDLGQMYLTGNGVPHDPAEAARWFGKAAAQGQANASLLLGQQCWNGDGVPQDRSRAAVLWHAAALRGQPRAPGLLAGYYFTAALVPAGPSSGPSLQTDPAVKAAYWGSVSAGTDPDPAARAKSQKLVDMIYGVAPNLRGDVSALLASHQPPPE